MTDITTLTEDDLYDGDKVADLFNHAAEAMLTTPGRDGSVVRLPSYGRVILTGDLHDHQVNFRRIVSLAELEADGFNHVVFHEMVHGERLLNGRDLSVRTLARIALLKVQYPDQVHVMMGNHEIAQYTGERILKDSLPVCDAFDKGIEYVFREEADQVRRSVHRFIASLLLAVWCPNGVMACHSLPNKQKIVGFDHGILDRVPSKRDLSTGGAAHRLVWGRNLPQSVADTLGEAWDAQLFVLGHQPADMGYTTQGDSMLIIASNHNHGVALPVDLSRRYTRDQLIDELIELASVVA